VFPREHGATLQRNASACMSLNVMMRLQNPLPHAREHDKLWTPWAQTNQTSVPRAWQCFRASTKSCRCRLHRRMHIARNILELRQVWPAVNVLKRTSVRCLRVLIILSVGRRESIGNTRVAGKPSGANVLLSPSLPLLKGNRLVC
jgi:hypothetical protein